MTRRHVFGLAFAAALVGVVAVGVSLAQNPPPGPPGPAFARQGGPPSAWRGLLRGLDLTQAQRDQLRALAESEREQRVALAERLRELNQALETALFADVPDQGTIGQLKTDLSLAHQQSLEARIAAQLQVAQVLTPEQRQKVREAQASGARGRRARWGMAPRPGGAGHLRPGR